MVIKCKQPYNSNTHTQNIEWANEWANKLMNEWANEWRGTINLIKITVDTPIEWPIDSIFTHHINWAFQFSRYKGFLKDCPNGLLTEQVSMKTCTLNHTLSASQRADNPYAYTNHAHIYSTISIIIAHQNILLMLCGFYSCLLYFDRVSLKYTNNSSHKVIRANLRHWYFVYSMKIT